MDVRVQDYLEDRLQTSADLSGLDALLESVKNQHVLLRQQLNDARSKHDAAAKKAKAHTESLREKAQAFEAEQSSIDTRLLIVTQSDAADHAAQKFKASMAKLHKLDVAAGYVRLLKEVDTLRQECAAHLGKSDEAALAPYRKLQKLLANMRPLQEAADGAAPHLVNYISQHINGVRETIRKSFAEDLEKTLKKMSWPNATDTVPIALQKEWQTNVFRLLDLQQPELASHDPGNVSRGYSEDVAVLLPVAVMIEPLEQRFNYHFSGNKPTNRLDKPEYFLSHTSDLIAKYSDMLQNALQPLLISRFRGSNLALVPAYIDATSAFITALLPMLKRKISSFASQVASQPDLLSHLVHEIMSFDATLRESFAYSPASPSIFWRGLTYYLLHGCAYFQPWLNAERDFALSRYRSIVDDQQAGEIDYDSVSAEVTKPTKAAIRVNDLLENVTDRYRLLPSFSQKLRFLMDIQISIFEDFHRHLSSGLEAYRSLTTSIGRRVQGMSREDQNELQGVKGLDRLCRIFGSASYLEHAMRDWSDDVFFLELWEELQARARDGPQVVSDYGGLLELQRKTSAAVGEKEDDAELQGALFDETAAAYDRLRARSEATMVETLINGVREVLRSYSRITTWASLSSATSNPSVSAELEPTMRLLGDFLAFLSRALGRAALRRVVRPVCHAIQTQLWDYVLMRHSFSTAGAAQFAADVGALAAQIDAHVGRGQARIGLRRIMDGVVLISLPIRGSKEESANAGSGQTGGGEDDEDMVWCDEGDTPASNDGGIEPGDGTLGLFEVEKLAFTDNEGARRVLQSLGLESLNESEARAMLERRVEIGS